MAGLPKTAEEFLDEKAGTRSKWITDIMIEFAKIHVKKALEHALEEVPYGGSDEVMYEDVVGILTCYPESNIK